MSIRRERLNSFMVQEVSAIIRSLKDPRLGFITVTQANVSPDLRSAQIGISILGTDEERAEGLKVLEGATRHIKRKLIKIANMKYVPEPKFYLDDGPIRSVRIQELLNSVKDEHNGTSAP